MKEQPIETREDSIGHSIGSIGQRPIHTTYEPPGPLPQFRPRPKLSPIQPPPQPPPRRVTHTTAPVKQGQQRGTPKAAPDQETAASKKEN